MKKIIVFILSVAFVSACLMSSHSVKAQEPDNGASQDSTVSVIAWFDKNDTIRYTIQSSNWKITTTDTIKNAGMTSLVELVVTDTTSSGYKMEYTYLDTKEDSIDSSDYMGRLQKDLAGKLSSKIVGTTIKFETDECGRITKFTNLEDIRKQAESLLKIVVAELMERPEMKQAKDLGLNVDNLMKSIPVDQMVEVYLEELKLLFGFHGLMFEIGEKNIVNEATDDTYEHQIYTSVFMDDDGSYHIINEVINNIPDSELKDLLTEIIGKLGDKSIAEELNKSYGKQVKLDCSKSSYLRVDYLSDGCPYKLLMQNSAMIGIVGTVRQTAVYIDYYSKFED